MTFPIGGVSLPAVPSVTLTGAAGLGGATGAAAAPSASGADFASVLASSLDRLHGTQATADTLATQAATGSLRDVADYMIASNEATLATDTVVTLKNQAVSAFTEIMRMPV